MIAANQISALNSSASIKAWSVSLIGRHASAKASNPRDKASSSDSAGTQRLQSHLCSPSKVIPQKLLASSQPPLPLSPLHLCLLFLCHSSISLSLLIINSGDDTGFTCKAIPSGSSGCCLVSVGGAADWIQACRPASQRASPEGAQRPVPRPQPQAQPQAGKEKREREEERERERGESAESSRGLDWWERAGNMSEES